MTELRFTLPWPPSANTYWRSLRGGRMAGLVLLSADARHYRKRVAESLLEQGIKCEQLNGSLAVDITAFPPDRRARDIDNLLKPTLDALIHAKLIEDDVFVDSLSIRRAHRVAKGQLQLILVQGLVAAEQIPLVASS